MGIFHLLMVLFACMICLSNAYSFIVGGKDGWVLNPSENYNQWAGRMRFLINDTLSFKYPKRSGSVLVVNKDDYDKCNTDNPIIKMDDGDSVFKFDRSGPFYFISGNKDNCDQGQKLIVVVLALRNPPPKSPPAPTPSPPVPPPTATTPVPSPDSSPSPSAPAVSPLAPEVSPAPGATIPASPSGTTVAPSPPSNSGNNTANIDSPPAPEGSYTPAAVPPPSVVLVASVSLVLSVALGSFITSH